MAYPFLNLTQFLTTELWNTLTDEPGSELYFTLTVRDKMSLDLQISSLTSVTLEKSSVQDKGS